MKKNQIPPIIKFDNNPQSIHYMDNDDDYDVFIKFLNDTNERDKNIIAHNINAMGNLLINEINNKRTVEIMRIKKLIPYILKHCNDKYSEEELLTYSLSDVNDIYNEYKEKNMNIIIKFFKYLLNL